MVFPKRFIRHLIVLSATVVSTRLCSMAVAQAPDIGKLGTNLNEVNDYSPQLPFNDLFLISRSWLTQCTAGVGGCSAGSAFDTGEAEKLDLDENGWVRSLQATSGPQVYTSVATFWDLPSELPSERYVVLYDGSGTIEYGLGAQKVQGLSGAGRDVVDVDLSGGGILLRITAIAPGNHPRNIRFVAARNEAILATERFSADFLKQLEPYKALRFMDWMRTNNSVLSSWTGRPKATDARYSTEKGVPVEVMVELANKTEKAPWFTMPHMADDNFIQNFATVVRDSLLPSLPVYVEYSNEVWNSAFSQGLWVEQQGNAEWPGQGDPFIRRLNWHGKRNAEICDLWRGVFAGQTERVVCVVASQAANSFTASEALSCPLWEEAPCGNHGIRALAIAPYMGNYIGDESSLPDVVAWTGEGDGGLGSLFTELTGGGALTGGPAGGAMAESFGWIDDNLTVANQFGVSLIAYEGGQHLVGVGSALNNESMTTLFTAANRDSRMGSAYQTYLNGWATRGGGLFMHFSDIGSYSRFGSWGALEKIGQSTSPKYEALYLYSLGVPTPRNSPGGASTRVRKIGRGEVISNPRGIRCGADCQGDFTQGSRVRLVARPGRGVRSISWSGVCRGAKRTCSFTARGTQSVRVVFR